MITYLPTDCLDFYQDVPPLPSSYTLFECPLQYNHLWGQSTRTNQHPSEQDAVYDSEFDTKVTNVIEVALTASVPRYACEASQHPHDELFKWIGFFRLVSWCKAVVLGMVFRLQWYIKSQVVLYTNYSQYFKLWN